MIWADESGGFVLEPLHRGFVYTSPMQINLVEDGLTRRLVTTPPISSSAA